MSTSTRKSLDLPPPTAPTPWGATGFGPTAFDLPSDGPSRRPVDLRFDTCHVGVVLRSVLLVHGVVGIGVLFVATSPMAWLMALASASAMSLPATLAWLILVCVARPLWPRLATPLQWAAMVALGALCGAFGWLQVHWLGLLVDERGPPWMAPVLAGAAMAAVLFAWLESRARRMQPAEAAARLAELQSRIRPHFLFNTLNTAIALVQVAPSQAERVLEDLAELFRVALAESGEAVTLADEVALARRYLEIEQLRFGERLQIEWRLDTSAGSARLPPLILQPLVENAVRHGVEASAAGGWLRVRTQVHRGHAIVTVSNPVPPGGSRPGHGMALRNVRERLALMHDVAARFEARQEGERFVARIVVPLDARGATGQPDPLS